MVAVISSEFQGDKVNIYLNELKMNVFSNNIKKTFQMEEAKKAIDKLDVDKDGKVSYPEFILVMKYKK